MKSDELSDEEKESVENAEVVDGEPTDGEPEIDEDAMEKFLKTEIGKKIDSIAQKIAEKNAKAIDEKRGQVVVNDEKDVDKEKENKNVAKFIKAIVNNDFATIKAMNTGDDAKGGYTIPEALETEILRVIKDEYGIARKEFRYMKLDSNELKLTTGASISTYWTDEGAKKTSTETTFGIATLALKKLAAIVPLTDELLEDSAIDLMSYISDLFAESIAEQEDLAFFNGTGVFTGLYNDTNIAKVNADDITADVLIDVQDAVKSSPSNKWFMHRSVASHIKKLKDANGNYEFPEFRKDGKTLLDSEVVLVEAGNAYSAVTSGKSFLVYGNAKKACVYGERAGIKMKTSSEATIRNVANDADIHLYEQDMTAIRAVKRTGYVIALPELMVKLEKN